MNVLIPSGTVDMKVYDANGDLINFKDLAYLYSGESIVLQFHDGTELVLKARKEKKNNES